MIKFTSLKLLLKSVKRSRHQIFTHNKVCKFKNQVKSLLEELNTGNLKKKQQKFKKLQNKKLKWNFKKRIRYSNDHSNDLNDLNDSNNSNDEFDSWRTAHK